MNSYWRAAGIVPAIAFIITGWLHWHEPGRAPALLASLVLALILPPVVVLMAPGWPAVLVSRRRRAAWRGRHPRSAPDTPEWLRRAVLAADQGGCVYCGDRTRLHVDHITPWSAGGLTTMYNLAVLCRRHNKIKSNFKVDPDGYVHYRAFEDHADPAAALAILARERRRRLYPRRWLRAAWSLRSSPAAGPALSRPPRPPSRPGKRGGAARLQRRGWRPAPRTPDRSQRRRRGGPS